MRDISLFLIIYAITMAFYIVQTYQRDTFAMTVAFAIMGSVSLLAALYTRTDEGYYENMDMFKLTLTILCLGGMIFVSTLFAWIVKEATIVTASVLFIPLVSLSTIGDSVTSVFSLILAEMIYQFAAVATSEELLKFSAYTELKRRYGLSVAILPIAFWAGFHALQAYSNVLYVIPAFLCGLLLVFLLEQTKSIIAPIIAHGAYNTICVASEYMRGKPNLPIFPVEITGMDLILIGLAAMWIAWILLPPLTRS